MNIAALRAAYTADPTLANLRALRAALKAELTRLADKPDAEFTAEDTEAFEALRSEREGTDADLERLEREERVRSARAKYKSVQVGTKEEPFDGRSVMSLTRKELRSKAGAVLGNQEMTSHLGDIDLPGNLADFDEERALRHVQSLLRKNTESFNGDVFARWFLATEAPAYRSAFPKLVGGQHWSLTDEERAAVAVVQELRATMNITTDEWKGITSAGATSYWTTEGVTMTDGGPTLAQPTVTAKKLTTLIKYTFEFQGDYPNWASQMATMMAEARSEKLVEAFTQGTGLAAQPTGIVTGLEANAATSKVMVATDGGLYPADFYALWGALPVKYRANARWMLNTSVSNAVRHFSVGSSAADANFTVNLMQSEIPQLFGKPVHYNDYMDNAVGSGGVTSASDITPVILGDWRNFLIVQRVGATIETVQHMIDTTTGNPNGTRGTFMWERVGSGVINPNGFRYLHQS